MMYKGLKTVKCPNKDSEKAGKTGQETCFFETTRNISPHFYESCPARSGSRLISRLAGHGVRPAKES
jgi:hypothetical protein